MFLLAEGLPGSDKMQKFPCEAERQGILALKSGAAPVEGNETLCQKHRPSTFSWRFLRHFPLSAADSVLVVGEPRRQKIANHGLLRVKQLANLNDGHL